jgi:hypothetical protein
MGKEMKREKKMNERKKESQKCKRAKERKGKEKIKHCRQFWKLYIRPRFKVRRSLRPKTVSLIFLFLFSFLFLGLYVDSVSSSHFLLVN